MAYIQQIGWFNLGVPPSLQLACKGDIYLFNVGEGSQRFRFENKLSIGRIYHIFLTDTSTSSIDGLTGLMFALESTTIEKLTIYGPPPTRKILQSIKDFYLHPAKYEICVRDIVENEFVELINGNGVTIYGSCHKGHLESKDIHVADASSEFKASYLIKLDDARGTFRPEEAIKLGVKQGVAFGLLKNGIPVQTEDGTWIQPIQVCDEPIKGKSVLVLHDNSMTSVDKVEKAKRISEKLECIFWMHSQHNYDRISETLSGIPLVPCDMFPQQAESYVAIPSAHYRNLVYNAFAPQLYTMLSTRTDISSYACECNTYQTYSSEHNSLFPPLSKYMLHPPNKSMMLENKTLLVETQQQFEVTDPDLVMPPFEEHLMGNPSITFLGTGGSAPSPLRNVSGILVHVSDTFAMLLDAGEGSLQQIYLRSKTFEEFMKTICNIKLAFMTHSHADHHLGLYSILAFQKKYTKLCNIETKMVVIAPERVLQWMEVYNEYISPIDYDGIVSTSGLNYDVIVDGSTLHVELFEVEHIFDSLGIKFGHRDTGSIVYSGDTRPCDNLIEAAMGCDILIQEATFHEEELDEAMQRCHTTLTEALCIADVCKVGTLILTHFSRRYQHIELHLPDDCENVIVAYDLLRVPIKAIKFIATPLMTAMKAIGKIFNEESS